MQTIGLIGGMSWESSAIYYQVINTVIKEKLGDLHSSKCILYSVDFYEIVKLQSDGNWEKASEILSDIAEKLENAGADFIVICTNTMHKVADKVAESISIPLLHIADATVRALKSNRIETVALLGTKYTMEQDFYISKLSENGINIIVPEEEERNIINDVIFNELCLGIISEKSKLAFMGIIEKLTNSGAQGVILGCTEIGSLIQQKDTSILLFDTTLIHAKEAAMFSIQV